MGTMTNQQILEKAIQRAIDNGYDKYLGEATILYLKQGILDFNTPEGIMTVRGFITNHDFAKALWGEYAKPVYEQHYIPARGYPGEAIPKENVNIDSKDDNDWKCTRCGLKWSKAFENSCNLILRGNTGWKNHLQMMVISDDPIKYLGENI